MVDDLTIKEVEEPVEKEMPVLGRPKGAKNKDGYKMSTQALKQRQTVPLKDGEHSVKFNQQLEELGFNKTAMKIEELKEYAPELVKDLELLEKKAQVRGIMLEMYKKTGDIGLNMLNHLRELEMKKMKLEDKMRGREDELILDKNYLQLMDLIRKINNDFTKLGIDKTRLVMDMNKGGDEEVIDIEGFEVK